MELHNITYRNRNANPVRNKAMYVRYTDLTTAGTKKGEAVNILSKEFNTGIDNVRRILRGVETKLGGDQQ